MMIKEQVKALWKICFDDSEEFVEMYFRLRYKTEVNVAIQSGDEVIFQEPVRIPISEAKGSCASFYHSLSPGCYGMEYTSAH